MSERGNSHHFVEAGLFDGIVGNSIRRKAGEWWRAAAEGASLARLHQYSVRAKSALRGTMPVLTGGRAERHGRRTLESRLCKQGKQGATLASPSPGIP